MERDEFNRFFYDTLRANAPWIYSSMNHMGDYILTSQGKIILCVSLNNDKTIFITQDNWLPDGRCINVMAFGDNLMFDKYNVGIVLKRDGVDIIEVAL